MRWLNVNAARGGALAAAFFIGLLVCCSVSTQSARAIECLTSPNQTERGWWSWREIDGRRCWYKKVGAVPPKSEFVWPDQQAKEEAQPGEERAGQEPIFMRATEPMPSALPEVEMARVKPVDPTVDFRLSEGLIDLTKGVSLAGFHGIGGALETPPYTPVSRDSFDDRFGQW
jgi:hypothetical protein